MIKKADINFNKGDRICIVGNERHYINVDG